MTASAFAPEEEELLRAARAAARRAAAPPAGRCGAIAATADGGRFPGATLVAADGAGPCACAERIAVWSARAATSAPVVRLALWVPAPAGHHPCGSCLQILRELAPGAQVLMQRGDDPPRRLDLEFLMPAAFLGFQPVAPPPAAREDPQP